MTAGLMRKLPPSSLIRVPHGLTHKPLAAAVAACQPTSTTPSSIPRQSRRNLAAVRNADGLASGVWFSGSSHQHLPAELGGADHNPPDERTLKLGRTIRILHERLPTLLQSPLPQEILSPQITLHLFPSTHPHLPTVSGRVAYHAALWTAPVAWGRMPVVGNVKLVVLSERMVRNGGSSSVAHGSRQEKLIVRWKTCGKTKGKGVGALYRGITGKEDPPVDKITEILGGDVRDDEEFCGLFIFEFDEEGRIFQHTIEHAEEGGNWDRMAKVVSVTDWLLGKVNGKKKEEIPELAWCHIDRRAGGGNRKQDDHRATSG
ncbi:hypothetical protein BJ546DRAFT_1035116 [Cryomyces antarcticus]|uniref:Uncharacterized protein n=1 Tax=Cryomyces antarcticus TaxID=329879 RepID=A0ABR0LZJ5_9PEZI|nr:hypothetical protein LTR16_001475 [Cryomyces antarcticus]